jgi:hypothetical protein
MYVILVGGDGENKETAFAVFSQMSGLIILNASDESGHPAEPDVSGKALMTSLRNLLANLKANFIDDSGRVNYRAMGSSQNFEDYLKLASDLKRIDLVTIF